MFSKLQHITFALHKVLVHLLFQSIQQGGSPFQSVHFPSQFGIITKFHQGILDLIVQITYDDTEQHWAQYSLLVHSCSFLIFLLHNIGMVL